MVTTFGNKPTVSVIFSLRDVALFRTWSDLLCDSDASQMTAVTVYFIFPNCFPCSFYYLVVIVATGIN